MEPKIPNAIRDECKPNDILSVNCNDKHCKLSRVETDEISLTVAHWRVTVELEALELVGDEDFGRVPVDGGPAQRFERLCQRRQVPGWRRDRLQCSCC